MLLALLLTSFTTFAQQEDCDETPDAKLKDAMKAAKIAEKQAQCPNKTKIENLCGDLNERLKDPKPLGKYRYTYQRKILEASCVDISSDSTEVIKTKISDMWSKLESQLVCNSASFDIQNGNIIKYAVALKFDEFIYDVSKWKIHLNRIDPSDNRTVLDYIKYHIERNKGNAAESVLQSYYDRLRSAGAKHKSEL